VTLSAIDIDRDDAREAAQHELAKPIYPRASPAQQFIDWVELLLRQLVNKGAAVPGGWFTISVLLIIVVAAAVAAIRIARRTLGTNRSDHRLFGTAELTAAEHRAAANRFAASDDWAAAIQHRLRAVARELEQTGVLDSAPSRTASELARDAGARIPSLSGEFSRAAGIFNDVSYGELPASATDYRVIAELDDRLRSTPEPWRQFR
jgi:type II secretory pathway pseudopilin PulG